MEKKRKIKFKNDLYTKRRGAPAMLNISCAQCTSYIMSYQKDGPGPLLRCYLDRIHYPKELEQLQTTVTSKQTCPNLLCSSCKELIGTPMVYEKENRLAFLMKPSSFKIARNASIGEEESVASTC